MQYVGFDIHKRYTFYTQIDAAGRIQRQGKLSNTQEAMAQFFGDIDEPAEVVVEASINWYHLYDLLESLAVPVTLAHPLRTRAIADAKVKTDKVDSHTLAQLLRSEEHTSELQSLAYLVCRLLLEKKKTSIQSTLRWLCS